MPWLRIKFHTDKNRADLLTDALNELGAISVTLEDAADQPLLEVKWDETPIWDNVWASALFDERVRLDDIREFLNQRGLIAADALVQTELLPDQDWERAWMDRYAPIEVGKKLWVVPSWLTPPDPNATNIVLDPGLAFGTGTHATTALCLNWLSHQDLKDKVVIDYGCGSGILAVAAALLGARMAIATDNDPKALEVTRENAERNGVLAKLKIMSPEELAEEPTADVLVANILALALIELAPRLTALTHPHGRLALSGIMNHQVDAVREAYAAHFDLAPTYKEEWALLAGVKKRV
jgi:ribosomal protein L11 methyltransferase